MPSQTASQLRSFVEESNRIEGIADVSDGDFEAHVAFLGLQSVGLADLEAFVFDIAGAKLRRREGMNVRVGPHRPPSGGEYIERQLRELLDYANRGADPHNIHVRYETLHPFMDGNGRSGRALWAWMMLRQDRDPFALSFLHRWYYDSLQAAR